MARRVREIGMSLPDLNMDEREGRYTRIEEHPERVVVWWTAAHRRGALLGMVFSGLIGGSFAIGLLQYEVSTRSVIACVTVAAVASGLFYSCWSTYRRCRKFPVVVFFDDWPVAEWSEIADQVRSDEIESIEVRENVARESDDVALWQTYVRIRGRAVPVLIYQSYFSKRGLQRQLTLAKRLSERWRIPLKRKLPASNCDRMERPCASRRK
jgi:hypothetical protein